MPWQWTHWVHNNAQRQQTTRNNPATSTDTMMPCKLNARYASKRRRNTFACRILLMHQRVPFAALKNTTLWLCGALLMTGRHKMQREAMGSKVKLDNKALAGLAVCRRNRRRDSRNCRRRTCCEACQAPTCCLASDMKRC